MGGGFVLVVLYTALHATPQQSWHSLEHVTSAQFSTEEACVWAGRNQVFLAEKVTKGTWVYWSCYDSTKPGKAPTTAAD